jgi:hypothetical protein
MPGERTADMKFKIFCGPGDQRDDFEVIEGQLNDWASRENPEIVDVRSSVNAMTDQANKSRYLLTVLVTYQPRGA